MAGDAIVGALRVVLGMDTAAYEDGVKSAGKATESFGKQIATIASGIQLSQVFDKLVSAFQSNIVGAINLGAALSDLSRKVGVPVETLSALKLAADLSGVGVKGLEDAFTTLGKQATEATGKPMSQAANAFRAIGVNAADIKGPLDNLFTVVTDRLSKYRDNATKATASTILLGDAGARIARQAGGAGGLKTLTDEAEKLGIVMATKTAQDAKALEDTLIKLGAAKDALFIKITSQLTPSLKRLADALVETSKEGGFFEKVASDINKTIQSDARDIEKAAALWEYLKGVFQDIVSAGSLPKLKETIDNIGIAFENLKNTLKGFAELIPTEPFRKLADAAGTAWDFIRTKTGLAVDAVSAKMGETSASLDGVGKSLTSLMAPNAEQIALLQKLSERTAEYSANNDKLTLSYSPLGQAIRDINDGFKNAADTAQAAFAKSQQEVNAKLLAGKDAFDKFIDSTTKATAATLADAQTARSAAGEREYLRVVMQAEEVAIANNVVRTEAQIRATYAAAEAAKGAAQAHAGVQLVLQNLTPWEAFNDQVAKNNALLAKNPELAAAVATANQKAAFSATAAYGQAAVTITSGFADAFKFLAEKNKKFATLAKAAAIANAIASTFVAANQAMAQTLWGGPAVQFAAAASVVAAGLANVAKISMTDFATGGSFKVGGVGGIDSQLISFRASPGEMVDVRKPGATGPTSEITIRGLSSREFFTGDMMRDLIYSLNAAHSDGYKLKFAE